MERKIEVRIINQPFVFIGEDEERIRKIAGFVDERIDKVKGTYGIVNTMNAVIMAMMELMNEYVEIRDQEERFKGRTLKLLEEVEEY